MSNSESARPLLPFSYNNSRPENELALPVLPLGTRKRDYPASESSDAFPIDSSTDADEMTEQMTIDEEAAAASLGGGKPSNTIFRNELPRASKHAPPSSYLRTVANAHKRIYQELPRTDLSDGLNEAWEMELPSSPPRDMQRSFAEETSGVPGRKRRGSFDASASFSGAGSSSAPFSTRGGGGGPLKVRAESMPMPITHVASFAKRPVSSSFVMPPPQSEATRQAISKISLAVEESQEIIDLSDLGLTEIPQEIKDLKDLVTMNAKDGTLGSRIQLFLGRNRIAKVPSFLFGLENLTVLILRTNKLTYLPPAIERLKNLVELGLNGNRLEYFPSQILELRQLNLLAIEPNPLMACPAMYARKPLTLGDIGLDERKSDLVFASCAVATRPKWVDYKYRNGYGISYGSAPPLSEFCLRTISQYRPTPKEQAVWESSLLLESKRQRIEHAYEMAEFSNTCGMCGKFMIDHVAYAMEWWDAVLKNNGVPIRREFCSARCVGVWEKQLRGNNLPLIEYE
ncbi:hypothetical protein BZA70DRAFT_272711 [Myxozyma melibiosi]|uniref:Uncharacterized protein n=1 Tax=Myxozyma melibiosi TaxID=54550 RepID=A0ABR1FDU4_9ASCO